MLIENSNFIIKDIPDFHPVIDRYEYVEWWKVHKRRCMEGYWVGGKWMSGPLYYYVNFHTIQFEEKGGPRRPGRPWLRDIDWELYNIYEEARGFSGWETVPVKDKLIVTSHRNYGEDWEKALLLKDIESEEELAKYNYISARERLRSIDVELGKPVYENEAKNVFSVQARGGGKSYSMSGIGTHNFLFDGATDYDKYLALKAEGASFQSDTIVGAVDTKFTTPLLGKIKLGIAKLPGKKTVRDVVYNSPLYVNWEGSWASGKTIKSLVSKSEINHRTFNTDPLAANGTRPNLAIIDEVGFLHNILEVLPALESTQTSSDFKKLVIFGLGTGGLVRGKAVIHAEEVFRNPLAYNGLEFEDVWEKRGKIGYFLPAHMTMNKYKEGPNLITNKEAALTEVKYRIDTAYKATDKSKGIAEQINRPEKPSDAFMSGEGSYFIAISAPLKVRQAQLLSEEKYLNSAYVGDLSYEGKVLRWTDLEIEPIHEYPVSKGSKKEGAIVLYEKPAHLMAGGANNLAVTDTYIAGIDVVDKAASTTDSLFCIIIMNRYTRRIAAEYFGRSIDPKVNYEKARKLLLYFDAIGMYEQNLPGLYTYFEQKRSLALLADTPPQLRNPSTFIIGTNTSKGINASAKVNSEGRKFILSYFMEPLSVHDDRTPASEIRSLGIIREILLWNKDGNFDRVSALGMLMWLDNTLYRREEEEHQEVIELSKKTDSYWDEMGLIADTRTREEEMLEKSGMNIADFQKKMFSDDFEKKLDEDADWR